MTCTTSEKLIYLYSELDPDQRKMLDRHLASCKSCRALLAEVEAYQQKVLQHSSSPVGTDDALTDRIMNTVMAAQRRPGPSSPHFVAALTNHYLSKAAFAVLSLFLVAVFIAEFNLPSIKATSGSHEYTDGKIKSAALNSQAFPDRYDSTVKKSFTPTVTACISVCRNNKQPATCEACQSRLRKLRTTYENI